jgi:hypothetical protein
MLWACLALAMAAQEPEGMIRFGTTVVMPDGLRGQIYFMNDNSGNLPNFRKLKPKGTIYTTSLNIPPQDFEVGFPGVTKRFEWFAIDYTGKFWVRSPGPYRFHLLSDDGSRLWIDGKLVVDNDGIHAPRVMHGEIGLSEGLHRIEVGYFQGPRAGVALVLTVSRPGEEGRVFNVDDFKPPPGVEIPREPEDSPKKK